MSRKNRYYSPEFKREALEMLAADNRLVLENILCSLKEDGKLVIEMIGKEILARIFLHRSWDQVGDAYLLQE
jgi:hypothetical protein